MKSDAIVLIVDDSPTNIKIVAACLKQHYRLKVATSGEQCLLLAKNMPQPDVILLDIEMPGMNGYDTCEALKKDNTTENIPVIFVTGRQGNEDEEKGLSLGAVDYITKPIHPAIVLARTKTQVIIKQQRDALQQIALHDQLTGLYNRHYLLDIADKKIANSLRHKYDLSVLMIDIDHFKKINDTHGHPIGDDVIKHVADILKSQNRTEDVVTRFGGEEFVVLLDHCSIGDAIIKAEEIRKVVAEATPNNIPVTISIGVAHLDNHKSFNSLLKSADLALYVAKNNGRNRVEQFVKQ
ncbi:MAG: diguanylate cyclase [Colwellia sp.]|nr:diguanylate cyclase [Colwellia sp.]